MRVPGVLKSGQPNTEPAAQYIGFRARWMRSLRRAGEAPCSFDSAGHDPINALQRPWLAPVGDHGFA